MEERVNENIEDENAQLPQEQPPIQDVHQDIYAMGDGPNIERQQDREIERGLIRMRARRLRQRYPALNERGQNIIEPIRRNGQFRRGGQRRARIATVRQRQARGMQTHNDPRLNLGQGEGPARPQAINVPGIFMGLGDGILAPPDQINPPARTRRGNVTVFSMNENAFRQMSHTREGREEQTSSDNDNQLEGPQ